LKLTLFQGRQPTKEITSPPPNGVTARTVVTVGRVTAE